MQIINVYKKKKSLLETSVCIYIYKLVLILNFIRWFCFGVNKKKGGYK